MALTKKEQEQVAQLNRLAILYLKVPHKVVMKYLTIGEWEEMQKIYVRVRM